MLRGHEQDGTAAASEVENSFIAPKVQLVEQAGPNHKLASQRAVQIESENGQHERHRYKHSPAPGDDGHDEVEDGHGRDQSRPVGGIDPIRSAPRGSDTLGHQGCFLAVTTMEPPTRTPQLTADSSGARKTAKAVEQVAWLRYGFRGGKTTWGIGAAFPRWDKSRSSHETSARRGIELPAQTANFLAAHMRAGLSSGPAPAQTTGGKRRCSRSCSRRDLSRDDSVGFAPHLLGLRLMCFVVRHLRIWLQYARASRLAHQPNPLRI